MLRNFAMTEAQLSPMINKVVAIEGGTQGDCRITLDCNSVLFKICLSRDSPDGSVEREYIRRLDGSLVSGDEEMEQEIYDELSDLLATLGQPFFRKFAPVQLDQELQPTLYHSLYMKVVPLRLITITGKAELQLQDHPSLSIPKSFSGRHLAQQCFKPSDIEVLSTLKQDTVFKVYSQGSIMCAKVTGCHNITKSIQREIDILQRLSQAKLTPQLHVPSLLGLISLEDDPDQVTGFLMDYIEPGPGTLELYASKIDSIPRPKRELWGRRICKELERLHRIGLIWGDVKAGNVLVEGTGDPWLVDFGGGFTDGWVDAHLVDSIEGDLQGLRRILEFLQISELDL